MPGLYIFHKRECDPKKCTALKLGRLKVAKIVYRISSLPTGSVLLYPFCDTYVSSADKDLVVAKGLSAIDCSWNRIEPVLKARRYEVRKLPFLLAANPTHYAIPYKLSTLEAIAAALYIVGFEDRSIEILNKVKWGSTFMALNGSPLKDYLNARNSDEVAKIDAIYRKEYQ